MLNNDFDDPSDPSTNETSTNNDRTIWAVVNLPEHGGVGAMEWREERDQLPSFGEGDQFWVINLPHTVSDEEITEALDCLLGEYDGPDGWEIGPVQ